MFNIISVDRTNKGWKDDIQYPCTFSIPGLVRGFNLEYQLPDGSTDYSSCIFISGELDEDNPIVVCDAELVGFSKGGCLTGNAAFRGYYNERYDEYGNTYYEEVPLSLFDGFTVSSDNQ